MTIKIENLQEKLAKSRETLAETLRLRGDSYFSWREEVCGDDSYTVRNLMLIMCACATVEELVEKFEKSENRDALKKMTNDSAGEDFVLLTYQLCKKIKEFRDSLADLAILEPVFLDAITQSEEINNAND